jgi:proline iminopeptidase
MAPITIDDRATLSSITRPTIVIVGQHDLIADSRLVVLEDSGHFGHVDAPGQFAQTVVDFVRSTPAQRDTSRILNAHVPTVGLWFAMTRIE